VGVPIRDIYQTSKNIFFESFDFKKDDNYIFVEIVVKRK
jgi:hypothetical protein